MPGRLEIIPAPERAGATLAHRDRLLADNRRAVVIDPGQHHAAALLGPELELDVRVRRDRGLEIGGEHLLTRHQADELVEDLARNDVAIGILAEPVSMMWETSALTSTRSPFLASFLSSLMRGFGVAMIFP